MSQLYSSTNFSSKQFSFKLVRYDFTKGNTFASSLSIDWWITIVKRFLFNPFICAMQLFQVQVYPSWQYQKEVS